MQSAWMGRAPLHMPVPGLGVKAFLDLSKTRSSVVRTHVGSRPDELCNIVGFCAFILFYCI